MESNSFITQMESGLRELKSLIRYRELFVTSNKGSFVSNDYLGLSIHPRLVEAARICPPGFTSSRGSRLLGGNSRWMEEAEEEIAAYFGSPEALVFSSGYLANQALVRTMGELSEHVFSDENNHASLIDAIRLSGKPKTLVSHNEWGDVTVSKTAKALLVTESLFSMDGDFMDIWALKTLWGESNSFLIIDEAHAGGVFARDGKLISMELPDWDRKAVVVTFGKAFGAHGAAVLCSKLVKEWLVNHARAFIYTTALPPLMVAVILESLKVLGQEAWRREELWKRAHRVRHVLRESGYRLSGKPTGSVWDEYSPIVPVLIPGEREVVSFCEKLRIKGIEVCPIRYPTVRKGTERVRIILSLLQTEGDVENLLNAMKELRGVLSV